MLATNRDPRRAAGLYRRRWQIKCLFAETKTRGPNLEDTRLRQPNKLCVLRAVVALAITCAQRVARQVQGRRHQQCHASLSAKIHLPRRSRRAAGPDPSAVTRTQPRRSHHPKCSQKQKNV